MSLAEVKRKYGQNPKEFTLFHLVQDFESAHSIKELFPFVNSGEYLLQPLGPLHYQNLLSLNGALHKDHDPSRVQSLKAALSRSLNSSVKPLDDLNSLLLYSQRFGDYDLTEFADDRIARIVNLVGRDEEALKGIGYQFSMAYFDSAARMQRMLLWLNDPNLPKVGRAVRSVSNALLTRQNEAIVMLKMQTGLSQSLNYSFLATNPSLYLSLI